MNWRAVVRIPAMTQIFLSKIIKITYVTTHSPTLPSLYLRHNSFSNPSVALPTSQLILQPFPRFTYVTAHSRTLPSLYLRHSSFSNPYVAYLRHSSFSNAFHQWAELILQPFHHFTYITTHSTTLPLLHLRHSSFSNPSFASPTSQALHLIHLANNPWCICLTSELILQPFCHLTYITAHCPTLPLLHLHHSSFYNPPVASPTSQFILQPFFCFSYITSSSLNSPGEPPMQCICLTSELFLQPFRHFTYVTAHCQTLPCSIYITVHSPTLLSLLLHHKLFT